jgi:hypothetical protein
MARRLTQPAEVAWRFAQALAEMVLPEPIREDPRRERVFIVAEPIGQRRAATP